MIKFNTISKIILISIIMLGKSSYAEELVDIHSINKNIVVDMKYNSNDNFLGRKLKGYNQNKCLLKKEVAEAVSEIQNKIEKENLGLKLYDCFRPQEAVNDMVEEITINNGVNISSKYTPNLNKSKLIEFGYISKNSNHTNGNTVDLTLINFSNKKEVDMGTFFDMFNKSSWTNDQSINNQAKANRIKLLKIMEESGFKNYKNEWWHYTYKNQQQET